jgi:hypothetical protein
MADGLAAPLRQAGLSVRATGRPSSNSTLMAKIVPIDVERDVDILGMQVGTGRIMEARDFASCQNEPTNGV